MMELDKAEAILVDSVTNEVLLTAKPLLNSSIEQQLPKKKYRVEIKTEDGETIVRYTNFINIDKDNETIHMEGIKAEGCKMKAR